MHRFSTIKYYWVKMTDAIYQPLPWSILKSNGSISGSGESPTPKIKLISPIPLEISVTVEHAQTQSKQQTGGAWEQPPRGAPGYQVSSDILFRLGLIANCSHTVQYLDCSDLNWRCNRYHLFLALYDPFGVDVPLNCDTTTTTKQQTSPGGGVRAGEKVKAWNRFSCFHFSVTINVITGVKPVYVISCVV